MIQLLLDSGAEMEIQNVRQGGYFTALHIAALKGNLKLVEYFWNISDDKEPVNALQTNPMTPIFFAVFGNHLPVVEFFVEKGYNLEGSSWYNFSHPLIEYALIGCDESGEMGKFIFEKIQDKCPSHNILHMAARKNLELGKH